MGNSQSGEVDLGVPVCCAARKQDVVMVSNGRPDVVQAQRKATRSGGVPDSSVPASLRLKAGDKMGVGVGAYFQVCEIDQKALQVRALLPDGPADKTGQISVADVVLAVNDEDVHGYGMRDTVAMVLGQPRSSVKIRMVAQRVFNGQAPASLMALKGLGKEEEAYDVILVRGME
mmetsp:Transcript_26002/g.61771  ORF Transcript_26002/g.61771 Transcript_26002/m.61771 type:complete len:174 (-) Transcript_26002:35-556(-)